MIEVERVTKSFGPTRAVGGVSFAVDEGAVLGLLGPNGAGKTTVVRMLATLLRPDRGAVRIAGIDPARDPNGVRALIGLAGQAAAVDELLTGRENLELVAGLYGLAMRARRERASEVLERFELADAADRLARTYSGGMRRRLDLAATLAGRPSVMLLDEPTAGLDPRSRNELWALVDEVVADGTTVLLTSQYLEEVERLADRIVVIDRGLVIADGTPDELKRAVGTDVLEARVADATSLDVARSLLADLGDGEATIDPENRRISLPTRQGMPALVTAARRLSDAEIALDDLGLRRPSLDDVFFALTDNDAIAQEPTATDARPTRGATARPRVEGPGRRRALGDMVAMTQRYVRRFVRIPQLLFLGTAQPVIFVLLFQAVFGGLVEEVRGGSYIQYVLPGVIIMNLMYGGGTTSLGIAEDVQAGIIDRFRSLPMSRSALLVGRTVADLGRNVLAIALIVVVGIALGYRFDGGAARAVGALGLILLFGYAISWLFATLGMAVKQAQAAQLAAFLPVLPLVFLSGILVPVDTMPGALQAFARNQPVNVVVEAVRALGDGTAAGTWVWQAVAWSVGILLVFVPLSVRQYRGAGV